MKRILIINEFYHPFIGGMEARFKRIAEEMVEEGDLVEVMCIAHTNDLKAIEKVNGVVINRVLHDDNYYKKGIFGRKLSTMFKFYTSIKKQLSKKNFDIVIIGQFSIFPIYFSKKLFSNGEVVFVDFVEYRFSNLWKPINRMILNATNKVSCISDSVRDVILERHPNLSPERVISIPNSVNMEEFYNQSEERFIFVGRMEPHKNPILAIKAMLAYNERYNTNFPIDIVGDGSLMNDIQREFGENSLVKIHGFVSEDEKRELLSNARTFVFPSDREGLPGVFIESLGSEVPLVTTNGKNNNSKDFVEREKVGVVTNKSIEDIVQGIRTIEENRDFYISQIKQAQNKYDLKHTIKKFKH